jgi:regulator of protease activity HflC (stomatin/prohibitin superfamily)
MKGKLERSLAEQTLDSLLKVEDMLRPKVPSIDLLTAVQQAIVEHRLAEERDFSYEQGQAEGDSGKQELPARLPF